MVYKAKIFGRMGEDSEGRTGICGKAACLMLKVFIFQVE